MATALVAVFSVGYLGIALEHPLKLNKAASALLLGVLCWTIYVLGGAHDVSVPDWFSQRAGDGGVHGLGLSFILEGQFLELVGEIAGLLFFLMGAMTIVELVDANEGFAIITRRITAQKVTGLLWLIGWLTFFMSAVLDNLTTTIVMVSLLRKVIADPVRRRYFVGLVVIAANAGGAWTPIGDVTTTMLWMDGKFTPVEVIKALLVPSMVCLLAPLAVMTFMMRSAGEPSQSNRHMSQAELDEVAEGLPQDDPVRQTVFFVLGVLGLLSVPVFKTLTHLPPFMGMLLSLSVLWVVAEIMDRNLDEHASKSSTGVVAVLRRIDMPSILFFLGILLAVGALGASGLLGHLAQLVDEAVGNQTLVAILVGLVSAVVDNVPLVAAGMDMYPFPDGHDFWLMLAYCAGTGGSCLIIGSAAGVAAMGLEHVDFVWYLRRIAPLALIGYLAGAGVHVLLGA